MWSGNTGDTTANGNSSSTVGLYPTTVGPYPSTVGPYPMGTAGPPVVTSSTEPTISRAAAPPGWDSSIQPEWTDEPASPALEPVVRTIMPPMHDLPTWGGGTVVDESLLSSVRVRAAIDRLNYDQLVYDHAIPDLMPAIMSNSAILQTRRYQPFIYRNIMYYGMFIDFIIRKALYTTWSSHGIRFDWGVEPGSEGLEAQLELYHDQQHWTRSLYPAAQLAAAALGMSQPPFSPEELTGNMGGLQTMINNTCKQWTAEHGRLVRYNVVLCDGNLEGHPDVVTETTVFEIKTTQSFAKMAQSACLQVLAYYALLRHKGVNTVRNVGFILPMQNQIVVYNVEKAYFKWYQQLLHDQAYILHSQECSANDYTCQAGDPLETSEVVAISLDDAHYVSDACSLLLGADEADYAMGHSHDSNDIISLILGEALGSLIQAYDPFADYVIGTHVGIGKNHVDSLRRYTDDHGNVPIQMFFVNPRRNESSGSVKLGDRRLDDLGAFIASRKLSLYTHTPYTINLCAYPEKRGWAQKQLDDNLRMNVYVGGRGTVVHTGCRKELSVEEGTNIMEGMVRQSLQYATPYSPLLIETDAGEGTSICVSLEDLANFFYRFSPTERQVMGVCIDTAHVWGAGYDPLEFFHRWEQTGIPVYLCHFNGSLVAKGSKRDRHASPGSKEDQIGLTTMLACAQYCKQHNIPMLLE